MKIKHTKVLPLLFVILISKVSFCSGPYGLILTPISLENEAVSSEVYSNQGTIEILRYEESTGGAYSNTVIADLSSPYMICSYTTVPGDYDGNEYINLADLSLFVLHWLDGNCLPWNAWCGGTDFNNNNDVNFKDFAEFASLWLQQ